ncbi:ABC transporter substrate-binding protein [Gemmobacter sp.]|uniref:ABC transporter substrate-binding protein n=1 Tax=Gemmobacter sp. TaxID=1898957 RepID=UPI002AFEB1E7|nr:ABC transporter substrate-binding protein [Gemmobacter sp.]
MTSKIKTLLGSVALTALATLAPVAAQAETYKVPILQALTGGAAFIGAPFAEGLKMAFDKANASGGFGEGVKIDYTVEDDASDKSQVITLMRRYANDPAVLIVAGPTSGAVSGVAGTVANEVKVPMMTVSNTVEARESGPYSFITAQPGPMVVPVVAKYAAEKVGVKKCQTIGITDNESYVTQAKVFVDTLAKSGVAIAVQIGLKGNETDFSAAAVRLASGDADCVFVAAPASMAANIIVQLKQAGLDPEAKIFGMTSMASPDLIRIGGGAVEGVTFIADWVPGGTNDVGAQFAKDFAAKHGRDPANWDAMGYSAGLVIADAIRRAGPNPTRDKVREAMNSTSALMVAVGQGGFSYDAERFPHFGINVVTVKDGKMVAAE